MIFKKYSHFTIYYAFRIRLGRRGRYSFRRRGRQEDGGEEDLLLEDANAVDGDLPPLDELEEEIMALEEAEEEPETMEELMEDLLEDPIEEEALMEALDEAASDNDKREVRKEQTSLEQLTHLSLFRRPSQGRRRKRRRRPRLVQPRQAHGSLAQLQENEAVVRGQGLHKVRPVRRGAKDRRRRGTRKWRRRRGSGGGRRRRRR